jgi:hypothetical protein
MSSEYLLVIFPSRFIRKYIQILSPHKSLIHHNCHGHYSAEVSLCNLLSGRCRNSGRTAASSAIRIQTRYIAGGERETRNYRQNLSFGCHYLTQTYFHITQVSILPSIYPFLTRHGLLFQR